MYSTIYFGDIVFFARKNLSPETRPGPVLFKNVPIFRQFDVTLSTDGVEWHNVS